MDKTNSLLWEALLRNSLNATNRSEYYEIDADFLKTGKQIFQAVRSVLTAYQYAGKLNREDVFDLLEKYSELDSDSESDNEKLLSEFYEETKKVLG